MFDSTFFNSSKKGGKIVFHSPRYYKCIQKLAFFWTPSSTSSLLPSSIFLYYYVPGSGKHDIKVVRNLVIASLSLG